MSKQLIFTYLDVEGFGSFGKPVRFNLDRRGINIMQGVNGVGKTTLFSALFWALYKSNLKGTLTSKVPTWPERRTDSWRGTRVMLCMRVPEDGVEYLIARHIKFKGETLGLSGGDSLMLFAKPIDAPEFLPEHMVADELFKSDGNAYIERIVGLSSDAFLSSVLFGQRMKRLTEVKDEDKREVFEAIMETQFIPAARERATLTLSAVNSDITALDVEIVKHNQGIEHCNARIISNNNIINEFNARIAQELATWDSTVALNLSELEKATNEYTFIKAKYDALPTDADLDRMEASAKISVNQCRSGNIELEHEIEYIKKNIRDRALKSVTDRMATVAEERRLRNDQALSVGNSLVELSGKKEAAIVKKQEAERTARLKACGDIDAKVEEARRLEEESRSVLDTHKDSLSRSKLAESRGAEAVELARQALTEAQAKLESVDTSCPYCGGELSPARIAEVSSNFSQAVDTCNKQLSSALASLEDVRKNQKVIEATLLAAQNQYNTVKAQLDHAITVQGQSKEFDVSKDPAVKKCVTALSKIEKEYASAEIEKQSIADRILELTAVHTQLESEMRALESSIVYVDAELTDAMDRLESGKLLLDSYLEEEARIHRLRLEGSQLAGSLEAARTAVEWAQSAVNSSKEKRDQVAQTQPPTVDSDEMVAKATAHSNELVRLGREHAELSARADRLKWWIKVGFGAGGLKANIFKSGLRMLNKAVERYADRLGVLLHFSIDMEKANKPFVTRCYMDNIEVDYKEFSGGQKARLDIATAFAMHDVVAATSNINILILDEVFEGLDTAGVETVFDLIRVKAGDAGRTVYVITHLNNIDATNAKTIEVEMEDDKFKNSYIC